MATIKEVAALARVSIATVSNVMAGIARVSPATRQRVLAAIEQLGYRPNHIARSLRSRRTRSIGMVISDITNPFFPEVVRGAEDAALARGYLLSTFNTGDLPEREKLIFTMLESRQTDGLLVVTALKRGQHPHVAAAMALGTPVVCLDRRPRDLAVDTVTVDNAAGVEMMVNHLIERGFCSIAYLGGGRGMYVAPERLAGYRRAMRKARLPLIEFRGDFRRESGYQVGKKILALQPRPEALVAANILMAAGFLEAIGEAGLEVPRDIALATFDKVAILRGFRPQLTCVEQPTYRMGYEGANLLIDRLELVTPHSDPVHLVLPCKLEVGESTRRCRPLRGRSLRAKPTP
mgnify:CR=1 FL=1